MLGAFTLDLAGDAAHAAGGCGYAANPEGQDLILTRCVLLVRTPSTGAANINVGLADSVASDTDLINALAINGAITGKAYSGNTHPDAKSEYPVWGADQYLTASASADASGFVGRLYVEYLRTEE